MGYTVWSRGRLIGHTELSYARSLPGLRCGDFEATDLGERLMPIIIGVGPALNTFHEVAIRARKAAKARGEKLKPGEFPDAVRSTTEYADAVSSQDELDSLALELHDKNGRVVKTDWIAIKDVEQLLASGRAAMLEDALELGIELDFDDPEPWEPKPPKYQIMVMLEGGERRLSRKAAKHRRRSSRSDFDQL